MKRGTQRERTASWPWPSLGGAIKASTFFLACVIIFTVYAAWDIGGNVRAWTYFAVAGSIGILYVIWWARRDLAKRRSGTVVSTKPRRNLAAIVGLGLIVNVLPVTVRATCMGIAVGAICAGGVYVLILAIVGGRQRPLTEPFDGARARSLNKD